MMDACAIIQSALDAALAADGVFSYWNQKTETDNADPREYIVYTQSVSPTFYADGEPQQETAEFDVRYYYQAQMLDSPQGRTAAATRIQQIIAALHAAGFRCNGPHDLGDIDAVGMEVALIGANYSWAVGHGED